MGRRLLCVVVVVRCDGQLSTCGQVTTRLVMSVISIKFLAEVWLVVAVGTVVSDGTTDQAHRRVIGLQVDGCCVSVDSIDWVMTKLQRFCRCSAAYGRKRRCHTAR